MTIPVIESADLERLEEAFPGLEFNDAERRAVLISTDTIDVQAAPGSGKTTLLAAKLLLMAQKWPHANRGICVLSHTNVARDEITKRLSPTSSGARLLGYPHFIGTIHAFVNQFMALPLLRSDGEAVDIIDNDVFAARALSLLQYKHKLNYWVNQHPYQGPDIVETLCYEGPDLKLGCEKGNLPGEGNPSHTQAKELKDELANRGVFRHADMFAFAERLLQRVPDLPKRLSWRFPLVLIDEMQDTSWMQEELLARAFDGTVVVQRYGDRNQRILCSSKDAAKLSFPRPGHLSVTTTKRCPEAITAAVRAVQEYRGGVVASVTDGVPSPVLMLYETMAATCVIEKFGKHVIQTLPDEVIRLGTVNAICARKQCSASADAGRHLVDYWPAYVSGILTTTGDESAFRLLADHPAMGVSQLGLDGRAREVKRVVLLALRKAGSQAVAGVRDASGLLHKLEADGVNCLPVRLLCRELTVGRGYTANAASWSATIDKLYTGLSPLLPEGMSRNDFGTLPLFEIPSGPASAVLTANECVVSSGERSVCIKIGTIASVKGETHVATLVMEAHGGQARCFDLEMALSNLSNGTPIASTTSEIKRSLYRNLYVAMSRPTHLLCLAINKSRTQLAQVQALIEKGWQVVEVGGAAH